MLAFDREMQAAPGNPTGRNQHSPEPETGTFDNIQDSSATAPTGTSAQAGLRRLRKATEAGDEKAAELLAMVIDLSENDRLRTPSQTMSEN